MKNAHERFGFAEFEKKLKDTTTRIRLTADCFIGEPANKSGASQGHLLSVFGTDVEVAALWAVGRGYLFYVTGEIPEKKDPRAVDEKLIAKYGLAIGKTARARRKAAGLANIQYIRYRRAFLLLATPGRHSFFEEERKFIRDVREVPIKFGGYAISCRAGHPHVRIEQGRYLELKAYSADISVHRTVERLKEEFSRMPFEPYAPIRSQLFGVLREVNRRRRLAQFDPVPPSCIRVRRRVVSPFEHSTAPSSRLTEPPEGVYSDTEKAVLNG